jgi:RNA polymerase sigma-70 factor (ECF subfamily)
VPGGQEAPERGRVDRRHLAAQLVEGAPAQLAQHVGVDDLDALAARAATGDSDALEHLLAEIQPRVRRICGRMLLYPEDAEEAAQDALLAIATKIDRFEGRSRFTTWLHAVASNSARSTYRSLKRRSAEQATDLIPTTQRDPRTTSVIAGSRLDLLEALDVVGAEHPELVEPLVLRDVQELEYADIAGLLEIPLGTVKSRIHRGRLALRDILSERMELFRG